MEFISLLVCTVFMFTYTSLANNNIQSQETWMKKKLIKSIRDELTEAERHTIFGSPHQINVPNFDVISPRNFHQNSRRKRSKFHSPSAFTSPSKSQEYLISNSDSEDKLPEKFIHFDGLGRKFELTLRPNLKLLDPDFVYLFRHENSSEILPEHHVRKKLPCFYQGTAYSYIAEENSANHSTTSKSSDSELETNRISSGPVALSLCGGLEGIILSTDEKSSEQEHYVIHPVPDRLHANGKLAHKNQHFLWKRDNGHTNVNKRRNSMTRDQVEANPSSSSAKNSYLNDYPEESTCAHNLGKESSFFNDKLDGQLHHYSANNGMNMDQSKKYRTQQENGNRLHRRNSRSRRSPLSIAPDSYWFQHRSTMSPWNYRSTERATLNQRGEEDDEYDAARSDAEYKWQKGILVYESSSSSSEVSQRSPADRALPLYAPSSPYIDNKKREKETKPRNIADWFENPEEILAYRSQSNYNSPKNYSNYSVMENGNKNLKGRRQDDFFGENYKSDLDSNIMEMKERQKRFDIKNLNIGRTGKDIGSKHSPTITIETAVIVDKDLYKHMQSNFPEDTQGEVTRIVLAMINEVQLLYQDPSLGHQVEFVLKRLEVLDSDPPGLLRPYDVDRFLTNFCKWIKTENPVSDADPLHWDHALMLTGLDLYTVHRAGKISNQVTGVAPVAGMCTRSSSCSVFEGRNFKAVYVIAHEIGHNLGMRHDGPQADNDCDPTSHIMSPTLGSEKTTWSTCSKKYLEMFLKLDQSKCLLDRARSESKLDHDADGKLPGERFDADRQCVLKYGRGSYHATQQPLEDVCRDLHCRREHYTWTSHPALEGTYCGLDMWCRAGRCVQRNSVPVSSLEHNSKFNDFNGSNKPLSGKWGKWSAYTDCISTCLYSNEGSLSMGSTGIRLAARRCDSSRPENVGSLWGFSCFGPDRRYETCSTVKICPLGGAMTTITQYANDVCNRATNVDTLSGRGFMKNTSDPERACSVWCETANRRASLTSGWSFPDGTACKRISQNSSASYYCVAGKCQEFSCSSDSNFGLSDEECGSTSAKEVTPRNWYGGTSGESNIGSSTNSPSNYRTSNADWSNWEIHSECKMGCLAPAKGLQLVKRNCSRGESNCSGLAVSVRLCKPDKATIQLSGCTTFQTPFEYATKICSRFSDKITGHSVIGMQLSATKEDPDRPCRITCQDNTVPYMVNGEEGWFPTGTDCSWGDPKKKAYCLEGKCIDFGRDDTPTYRISTRLLRNLEALFHITKSTA